ncbi:TetR/AcrR family transcriptional regulator [Pendulispora albinea]|uniref:TetR/AcrR family transcriptional regulator n=1 Tax=Pendulispora albinea TaxID=2741071 RepID=A0ABZ2M6B5_9BACT
MGRPKTFDDDEVLERVIDCFWRMGYHAVSVRDLEAATGLLKGSLYAAFGDKRSLFLAALARYSEWGPREIQSILAAAPTPREGIERYLRLRAEHCSTGQTRQRGCFLANTAAELSPHDPEIQALVRDGFTKLAEALEPAILAAQKLGQIDRAHDARTLARHLVVLVQGMTVVGKTETDPVLVGAAVQMGLSLINSHASEIAP